MERPALESCVCLPFFVGLVSWEEIGAVILLAVATGTNTTVRAPSNKRTLWNTLDWLIFVLLEKNVLLTT